MRVCVGLCGWKRILKCGLVRADPSTSFGAVLRLFALLVGSVRLRADPSGSSGAVLQLLALLVGSVRNRSEPSGSISAICIYGFALQDS